MGNAGRRNPTPPTPYQAVRAAGACRQGALRRGWLVQWPAVGRSVNSRAGACTAKRGVVSRTLGCRWARMLAFVQVCMDWSKVLRLPTSALPPRAVGPGDFLVPSDLLQGGVVPYPEPTDPIPR